MNIHITKYLLIFVIICFNIQLNICDDTNKGPDKLPFTVFTKPLLEVLSPTNGQVLENDKVLIKLSIQGYKYPSNFRDSKICISLAKGRTLIIEKCFDQTNALEFQISGLSAGNTYQLKTFLLHKSKVIAGYT